MKFREFEAEVRGAILAAAEGKGYKLAEVELLRPPNPELGDVSSPVGLRIAREARKAPGVIAQEIAETVGANAKSWRLIGGVEAHDSGYVNFRTNWGLFAYELLQSVLKPAGGLLSLDAPGDRKRVAIEHTNVNPNKALHIGHARNLVLGDSLVRTMKRLGHEVQTLNYIDDSGAQVADVIVGLKFLGFSDQAPEGVKFDAYCGDVVYTKVNQVYERDPSLKEKQRLVLKEIEKGTGELSEYAEKIVSRILAAQLETCWRLGARYDLLNWESHILRTGMWKDVFEELKSEGHSRARDGGRERGLLGGEGQGARGRQGAGEVGRHGPLRREGHPLRRVEDRARRRPVLISRVRHAARREHPLEHDRRADGRGGSALAPEVRRG